MIKTRTISQISSPSGRIREKRKPKLIDQIPVDVQLRIVELYKGGMSMRQIGELLVREGVESPDMVVPWGTAVISIVINTHK
jgi:hypothetical protein